MARLLRACTIILTIVTLLTLGGCVGSSEFQIQKMGFADRIRLDREPLTNAQKQQDPRLGTFETAPDKLIAEIYPRSMRYGIPDNLPRSDCLWLGHSKDEWGGGDAIQMSWETIVGILDEDGKPVFKGDNLLGACRLDNPVDRQPPYFEGGTPQPWPITVDEDIALAFAIPDIDDIQGDRPPDWVVRPENDILDFYIPLLYEHGNSANNDYGECFFRGFQDDNPTLVKDNHLGFNCTNTDKGRVQACGLCELMPWTDASYLLTSDSPGTFPRWMLPNIMVVQGERRMARRMAATDQSGRGFSWSTPVTTVAYQWQKSSWRENFSSNVSVAKVRFFQVAPDGTETPLSNVTNARLFIKDEPNSSGSRWTCTGQLTANEGMVFYLRRSDLCQGPEPFPRLTPTYDIAMLDEQPGHPLSHPLTWQVQFDDSPTSAVYIDFTLEAYAFSPPALRMSMAVMDLGDVQVDHSSQLLAKGFVTNVGGHTMRIDKITILSYPDNVDAIYNAPEATFTYRLPYEPKAVPVPIDVLGDKKGKELTVALGKDFKEFPLLKAKKSKVCKNEEVLPVKSVSGVHDGKTLNLYGEPVEFDGQWAFYKNPKADFALKARAYYADGAERFIARTAYNERTLPFDLLPGQSFDVLVTAQPKTVGGLSARLEVESTSLVDPQRYIPLVAATLVVKSLQGPTLYFMPSILYFPRQYGGNENWELNVLIENTGHLDMIRSDISIVGTDASRFSLVTSHAATHIVPSGSSEIFQVRYTPRICGDPNDPEPASWWHEAELKISTDGGKAVVPLKGNGQTCRIRKPRPSPGSSPPRARSWDW